ncbi:hypothetical protein [Cohnella panacarvi]|uniref:hypothetical protein n=1 Tax=Cohnella panacarvi TaxID=400776 RepID=UPI000479CCF8|nr:hypothetical protein [Cohnella panacarvi]
MTNVDNRLRESFRHEADKTLFMQMDLSYEMKRNIRRQASALTAGRRPVLPRTWITGAVALAAAIMIITGFPKLQHPAIPAPTEQTAEPPSSSNTGATGSELSSLITTTLGSADEARAAFGDELHVPAALPDGFRLSEIVAAGAQGEPARDVVFTYVSGSESFTFVASRMAAGFPQELFTSAKVGGADGFVFEQPELVELYWSQDGIQYSIVGNLSAEQAMNTAESAQP